MTTETMQPRRNVTDYHQAMTTEMIRGDLDARRSPMVTLCMNLTSDFNKASIVRANNAFLGREVWMIGHKRYDKRGTVGTHHYEHVKHSVDLAAVIAALREEGYTIFAVDNVPGASSIEKTTFPEKSAFLYGEEQAGLSEEDIALCDHVVFIPQRGSVRSINVSAAAAVVMYEYSRQVVPG